MIDKKKVVAFVLSVVAICSLAGCGNKEDIKAEKPNNDVVSQETENEKTENNSIVGTWVVEKTEVYDGPLKELAQQVADACYYVGAEYEFTDDGIFRNVDGKIPDTQYSILNDNQILMKVVKVVGTGDKNIDENINDYELNGDEFILYGCYTGSYADFYENSGYPCATYFKRK